MNSLQQSRFAPVAGCRKSVSRLPLALGIFLIVFAAYSHGASRYEDEVIATIRDIENQDVNSSIDSLNKLLKDYPNSKLGHLVLADLMANRAGSRKLINRFASDKSQLNGLRDEIQYRWMHNVWETPALSGLIPSNLVQTAPNQRYSLVLDASLARLYIYEHLADSIRLVDSYYTTVGKQGMGKSLEGDLRTPVGVYFVTSYLPGETLPPRYGPGAFPIDYPNEFDKRKKRTGYGIWIHGTEPENYNRVPLASDGCISLSNDEFIDIGKYILTDGSTPVIISEKFDWVEPDTVTEEREKFINLVNQWKQDWESLDNERYLRHYSENDFRNNEYDFKSWVKYKSRVNKSKKYIKINISNLSIFSYPGERDMVVVSFDQSYTSDNYKSNSPKKQYWKRENNGAWKIVYEG